MPHKYWLLLTDYFASDTAALSTNNWMLELHQTVVKCGYVFKYWCLSG